MPKVKVVDGDVEGAIRKFKRISGETRRNAIRHEYHLRPGLRAREKSKLAKRKMQKKRRRF